MRFAFEHLKVVAEPGGAVALAAVLAGKVDAQGRTVGVVISGGNVDPAVFARALPRPDAARTCTTAPSSWLPRSRARRLASCTILRHPAGGGGA